MDQALLLKYDRPVPRYTSYPTAPHFHAGVGPEDVKRWVAEANAAAPASLYVHVPYCKQMCWYCGCHTKIVARYQPVQDFARRLEREMALAGDMLGGKRRLSQVHWGGGTPNVLSAADLHHLSAAIHQHFACDGETEVAMELDPRGVDDDLIPVLKAIGLSRASLGIQDFDPTVQKAINRIQPYAMVEMVVDHLRAIGVNNINFDLIYGLPHQTEDGFARSVELALALKPDRLAVFGYAHVPWMKKHQNQIVEEALPDAALRLALAEAAAAQIVAAGYRRIGLDHFARPEDPMTRALDAGMLRRNFQGYTTDDAEILVGLGPSAISALPGGYAQNAADIAVWGRAIDAGTLAIQRGIALSAEDRWRRAAIERLMCFGALDLAALARDFDLPNAQFAAERARLAPLIADGVCTLAGNRIAIPDSHASLSRLVAACFDAYLNAGPGRHSRAV